MLWVWLSLGSAVFYALGALVGKRVLQRAHALEYAASQSLYALLLVLVLPFLPLHLSFGLVGALYFLSFVLAAGNLYYLKSIRHSELSESVPLMNISPLFLLVLAFVFLGELPSRLDIVGIFLLIVGAYFVQLTSMRIADFWKPFRVLLTSRSALYMIFAVLVFSFTAVMQKALLNWGVSAISLLVLTRLFVALNYVFLEVVVHGFQEILRNLHRDGRAILTSTLASFFSDFFLVLAMAVPGALVSLIIPLKRTSTFLTALIGGRLFHEHRLFLKLVGCLIMLAGVLIIAL